jgi:hypothetical protein
MLDMQDDFQTDICDKLNRGPLNPFKLIEALKSLTPAEFAKLEDDLDFAQFTGVVSEDVKALAKRLDDEALILAA